MVKKSKKVALVKPAQKSDNRSGAGIELTFSAESKQALETHPKSRVAMEKLQLLTFKFFKEIQQIENLTGLDISARPIFDMRIKEQTNGIV